MYKGVIWIYPGTGEDRVGGELLAIHDRQMNRYALFARYGSVDAHSWMKKLNEGRASLYDLIWHAQEEIR